MSISSVLVNYNSWSLIERVLENLPDGVEKIVVDNASRTPPPQDHPDDIILIRNPRNLGFAAALNVGISRARGEFILIATPDVEFDSSVVLELTRFLQENERVAAVVPSSRTPSGKVWPMARMVDRPEMFFLCGRRSPLSRFFPSCRRDFLYLEARGPTKVEAVVGTFMMLRKSAWEDVGGFDPGLFFYTEDLDISIRLRKKGWELYLLPHLSIIHRVGEVRKAHSLFAETKRIISFYRFFVKNYPVMRWLALLLFSGAFGQIALTSFRHFMGIPPKDPHW